MRYIFLFAFILPITLHGADSCEQITSLTCSPGTLSDGTGSLTIGPSANEQRSLFLAAQRPKILERFQRDLRSSSNEDLRLALETTGSQFRDECASVTSASNLSAQCQQLLAQGLTDRLIHDLTSNSRWFSDEDNTSLANEYNLRQTSLYSGVLTEFHTQLSNELQDPQTVQRVEKNLFPKTKNLLARLVQSSITDPRQREILLARVNSVEFGGSNCPKKNPVSLSGEFEPNAYYQVSTNQFYFCNSIYRNGMSDYMAVQTIAHELAHSIDPCRITKGNPPSGFNYTSTDTEAMQREFPFGNLLQCLRDYRSISALPAAVEELSQNPFCDDGEQICESFADWMAMEVLVQYTDTELKGATAHQYRNGIANVWRNFCPDNFVLPFDNNESNHPPTGQRLTKLMLTHPRLRERLGCSPINSNQSIYCDGRSYTPPQEEDYAEEETDSEH